MACITTHLATATAALRAGKLVAFPTETVYGLGAWAHNDDAITRVFTLKGRPLDHPLIVHLRDADLLGAWAAQVPATAHELAARWWPGPLTLVLQRHPQHGRRAAGGRPTIALRVPAHPLAQQLTTSLEALVAPSANRFGRPSPTTAQHVLDDFAHDNDLLVLDGGPTKLGIESTVVDLSDPTTPTLLRPGALACAELEQITGPLLTATATGGAPGTLAAHYAPQQPLILLDSTTFATTSQQPASQVAALGFDRPPWVTTALWRQLPATPTAAAKVLFAFLRELEATDAQLIAAQQPPDTPAWAAIRDRLTRAAARD